MSATEDFPILADCATGRHGAHVAREAEAVLIVIDGLRADVERQRAQVQSDRLRRKTQIVRTYEVLKTQGDFDWTVHIDQEDIEVMDAAFDGWRPVIDEYLKDWTPPTKKENER